MILHVSKPAVALIAQSHFDDEPSLIPLTPELQKLWSKRAKQNTNRTPKLDVRLN